MMANNLLIINGLKSSENADFGGAATLADPNRDPECFGTVWTSWTRQFGKSLILDVIAHNGRIGIRFLTLGDFGSKRPRVRIPILRPWKTAVFAA